MRPYDRLREALLKTEVIRPPRQSIATFGETEIEYYMISEIVRFPDRCRLRQGDLVAKRPRIITPEGLLEKFEGFGSDGRRFGDWLLKAFGGELRGLHYRFAHQLHSSRLEHASPRELISRLNERIGPDAARRVTILKGPDEAWQLSLLSSILEISSRSFKSNVQELEERGFFDPSGRSAHRRTFEIEGLFKEASLDRSRLPLLARRLKDYGLFERYQDRFFSLLKHP